MDLAGRSSQNQIYRQTHISLADPFRVKRVGQWEEVQRKILNPAIACRHYAVHG
ncbi:unnamed protein product [Strongylus vulgaris]|uniref:Uncharacterized protein n=1 Tax=Strongylus vulgaris TaxID=40348 RepID=A0A3P7JHA0_STRVU|nr:unnamed protein product [Strongylus vulgaris]